jgi:threonine dehydrogenase-like Zn-dependent dehydrogenase
MPSVIAGSVALGTVLSLGVSPASQPIVGERAELQMAHVARDAAEEVCLPKSADSKAAHLAQAEHRVSPSRRGRTAQLRVGIGPIA